MPTNQPEVRENRLVVSNCASPWNSPGQNTVSRQPFPSPGDLPNPGLLHCRWILYQLSHEGSPRILECCSLPLLQRIFLTQESNQGLLHCRWILYQVSYHREAPNQQLTKSPDRPRSSCETEQNSGNLSMYHRFPQRIMCIAP